MSDAAFMWLVIAVLLVALFGGLWLVVRLDVEEAEESRKNLTKEESDE